MGNKYYIPEISEIYIGFEYEVKHYYLDKLEYGDFSKAIVSLSTFQFAIMELRQSRVRVKHLDKEDIESLGWKCYKLFKTSNNGTDISDNYIFKYENKYHLISDFSKGGMLILKGNKLISSDITKIFSGIIKNKSELKKLMQQLEIT